MFQTKRILKYGVSGPDVASLQSILASQGYFNAWVGGNFKALTRGALLDFQMQHIDPKTGRQLAVDGEVWPGYGTERALRDPSGTKQKNGFADVVTSPKSRASALVNIPEGIGAERHLFLEFALKDYMKGVREIPDGSNGGDGVDRYLEGIGNTYWCCFCVSQFFMDAFGRWPLGKRQGHCVSFRNQARREGVYVAKREGLPVPGDVFVMVTNSRTSAGHTGIVLRVGDDGFNAIEGNCGNRLKITYRPFSQGTLDGYISLLPPPPSKDWERGLTSKTLEFLNDSTR